MPKITIRDIADSVTGLRETAKTLRDALSGPHVDGGPKEGPLVYVRVLPLSRQADYLDQVADELATLIPDEPVKIPD